MAFIPTLMVAQESDFNKWSVSLDAGANNFFRTISPGAITDSPAFITANIGLRYMINPKIGFMGDFGYSTLENANESSVQFDNTYIRGSFQLVTNVTNLLDIRDTWWKNAGLLFHFGGGVSFLNIDTVGNDSSDGMVNLIAGISPQIKLSERISLKGDISILGHLSQDSTWDGASATSEFVDGGLLTTTLGIEIALGKKDKHADWVDASANRKEIDELKEKIANLEKDLLDSDQDGVADYLDREPNTVSGATVNTKGITVDNNRNGIPDEFETAMDRKYLTETSAEDDIDAITKLVNDGYINVYFNTASATPAIASTDNINYLITYLNNNPTASGKLLGFADKRGSNAYNENLSTRRAKKIYDILVESGIDASRLSYEGNGEEDSSNAKTSLQLRRKVVFKLN